VTSDVVEQFGPDLTADIVQVGATTRVHGRYWFIYMAAASSMCK
jgi:hypothetical protein